MSEHETSKGRLHDKVIVIIGGTSGLGAAAVEACCREGARVVTVGRDESKCRAIAALCGTSVHAFAADARDEPTAERAIAEAVQRFGRLDGLYHVAGGSGRSFGDGPLHQISRSGWDETLHWNLTSLFFSNRSAIRQFLVQQTGGSILNMASVLAMHPAPAYFATHAYTAAKAAIMGMSKAAAAYYAPHSIRVNCIVPGLVETPMSGRAAHDRQIMDFVSRKQPLEGGRIARASDLNGAVIYFLSDESRFVTGQTLAIDGGWSVSDAAATVGSHELRGNDQHPLTDQAT